MEAISRMPNWEEEEEAAILAIADFCLGEFNLAWGLILPQIFLTYLPQICKGKSKCLISLISDTT
jgi:hypothetical protein